MYFHFTVLGFADTVAFKKHVYGRHAVLSPEVNCSRVSRNDVLFQDINHFFDAALCWNYTDQNDMCQQIQKRNPAEIEFYYQFVQVTVPEVQKIYYNSVSQNNDFWKAHCQVRFWRVHSVYYNIVQVLLTQPPPSVICSCRPYSMTRASLGLLLTFLIFHQSS